MKKLIYLPILVVLVMLPVNSALAQVPLDQQFGDAVADLEPDAQLEFLALIRDPGEWEGAFERLGIVPELADQIEDRLDAWDDGHQQEQAFKKLETIDDKITRKLANIKDGQIGKAEKTIEKALKKADKVLAKIEKKQAKAEDKADKDKDAPEPEPDPEPEPEPDDDKDKKDKKDKK